MISDTLTKLGISEQEAKELIERLAPSVPYTWIGGRIRAEQEWEFLRPILQPHFRTVSVGHVLEGEQDRKLSIRSVTPGGAASLKVGEGGSGNRYAVVDLTGDDTYTNWGLRLIRENTGPNTASRLQHRGSGPLIIEATDGGNIVFTGPVLSNVIGDVNLGAAAASISFQNIPQTYQHLRLLASVRAADAVIVRTTRMRGNNRSGATDYLWDRMIHSSAGSATVGSVGASFMEVGRMPGGSVTAGVFGILTMDILNYSATTKRPNQLHLATWRDGGGLGNFNTGHGWGELAFAEALSRIDLFADVGNLAAGSRATLLGIRAI